MSADHGWRTNLWRGDAEWTSDEETASHQDTSGVPFILKLPGETSGVVYTKPFNTLITRQLITAVLKRELRDPATRILVSSAARRSPPGEGAP